MLPEVPVLAVKVKVFPGQTELLGAPTLLLVVKENVRLLLIFKPLMTTVFVPWQPKLSQTTEYVEGNMVADVVVEKVVPLVEVPDAKLLVGGAMNV